MGQVLEVCLIESWALSRPAHISALPRRIGAHSAECSRFRQRSRAQDREDLFGLGGHLASNEVQPPLRETRDPCRLTDGESNLTSMTGRDAYDLLGRRQMVVYVHRHLVTFKRIDRVRNVLIAQDTDKLVEFL